MQLGFSDVTMARIPKQKICYDLNFHILSLFNFGVQFWLNKNNIKAKPVMILVKACCLPA